MEELLFLLIDILFWSVCYGTGYVITPILSLGRWKPRKLEKDKNLRKEKRKARQGFIVLESETTYLDADGVAIIGFCFWVAMVGIAVIVAL